MKREAGLALGVLMVGLILGGCRSSQALQDRMDQSALRELFGLPRRAEVVEYDGYPPMVGFGQREGLGLSAAFQLEPEEAQAFLETAAEAGWEPLAIPAGLVARIPFRGLDVPLDWTDGLYLCRTAGDNVLHAETTRSCAETADFHDLILGVYDPSTQMVWVTVRSGY